MEDVILPMDATKEVMFATIHATLFHKHQRSAEENSWYQHRHNLNALVGAVARQKETALSSILC